MSYPNRPIAYILAATNHGSMIVNRNDRCMVTENSGYGVGFQILEQSSYDPSEVELLLMLLNCRRQHFGDGVVAIDGGANIGVHTVEWARHMHGWGKVTGFEAQEVVFYALAGNIALNNCLNARVKLAALGEFCGEIDIPLPNYFAPSSFGSLEIKKRPDTQSIGQTISYESFACNTIPLVTLDSLKLERLDLMKIDVEGMEMEVLRGGRATIERHHPIMVVEAIKSDASAITSFFTDMGYRVSRVGINLLAIHTTDPAHNQIKVEGDVITYTP